MFKTMFDAMPGTPLGWAFTDFYKNEDFVFTGVTAAANLSFFHYPVRADFLKSIA